MGTLSADVSTTLKHMLQLLRKPYLLMLGAGCILSTISSGTLPARAEIDPVFLEVPPPSSLIIPAAVAAEKTQQASSESTAVRGPANNRVLVMIDPGHGGKDSGAIGVGGLREVDVILPIALRVSEILNKNGVATKLTRDRDYFVGLDERVQMSAQAGANIFVSIHANSIDNRPDVNGLETYHYKIGEELANTVHRRIIDYFNSDLKIPLNDRRVRSARFLVLRKSDIPAILVETGYLSSPEESTALGRSDYQDKMAEAIAAGILDYLNKSAKQGNTSTQHS